MALKFKLAKSAYDALPDGIKGEYIAGSNDGEYVLDVTDLPQGEDVGPIKRALERSKAQYDTIKGKLDEATAKINDFPDVEKLTADHKAATAKLTTFVDKTLRESVAGSLAAKISNAPSLLAPHIASRIAVDMTGDEPKTVILGKDGKPDAAMTIDKLREEVVANPDYKAIIIASKASGGGAPANGSIKPLSGGALKDGEQAPDLSALDGKSLAARITARKEASAQS